MMSYPRRKKQKIPWRVPVRGTLFAILAAVVLILLLTLFVYLGWFGESAIPIGNTVIKALAAAVAGLVVGRHRIRAAWWYGDRRRCRRACAVGGHEPVSRRMESFVGTVRGSFDERRDRRRDRRAAAAAQTGLNQSER